MEKSQDPGFIKISRNILDWEWYSDPCTKSVFLHCILKANWKDKTWKGVKIKRGQFVTSLASLADETGLSMKNVRTALDHLKSTNELAIESSPKGRIITVKNYAKYQDVANKPANKRQTGGKASANDWQTGGKQVATTKKDKKDTTYLKEEREEGGCAAIAPPGHEGQGQEDEKPRVPVPGSGMDENGFRVYEV